VFTQQNWNVPQVVTVTGVDDVVDDGDTAYTIVTGVAVSATGYNTDLIRAMWRSRMSITTRRALLSRPRPADDNRGRRHGDVHRRAGHAAPLRCHDRPSLLASERRASRARGADIHRAELEYSADGHRDRRCRPGSGRGRGLFHSDYPAVSNDPQYQGLDPANVAVVNQNVDLLDLKIANLAVTPSTGLKSGDSVTLSWSVTNTGTVATPRSFSDSVVVKNLRTNQILLNSQVLYDPTLSEMALFSRALRERGNIRSILRRGWTELAIFSSQ